jgi:hypothetical protein
MLYAFSNQKSEICNPKSLQFLFHRLHLGGDSILTLFPVVTLDGKINPVTVLAQFLKAAGHYSQNLVEFPFDAGAHGAELVWQPAFSDYSY